MSTSLSTGQIVDIFYSTREHAVKPGHQHDIEVIDLIPETNKTNLYVTLKNVLHKASGRFDAAAYKL